MKFVNLQLDNKISHGVLLSVFVILTSFLVGFAIPEVKVSLSLASLDSTEEKPLQVAQSTKLDSRGIPIGKQEFTFMTGENNPLKIQRVIIDPVDVHPGDAQTLSLVASSPDRIKRAWATTQLDSQTFTLELKLIGPAPQELLRSPKAFVDYNNGNRVVLLDEMPVQQIFAYNWARVATAIEQTPMLYRASWVVEDVHEKGYITEFNVEDEAGRTAYASLGWTDPSCYPSISKTAASTISSSCTWSQPNGADNTVTVNGAVTLTSEWIFRGADKGNFGITVGTGSIAVGTDAVLIDGYACGTDADNDGYNPNNTWFASSASDCGGSGYIRRNATNASIRFELLGYDCDDTNASVTDSTTHSHSGYEQLNYYEEKTVVQYLQQDLNALSRLSTTFDETSGYTFALNCSGNSAPTDNCSRTYCDGIDYGFTNNDLYVDGKYGYCSQQGAADFQTFKGLTIDGVVGSGTWSSLATEASQACLPNHSGGGVQPTACEPNAFCYPVTMHTHGTYYCQVVGFSSACSITSGPGGSLPGRRCKHEHRVWCNGSGTACSVTTYVNQSYDSSSSFCAS